MFERHLYWLPPAQTLWGVESKSTREVRAFHQNLNLRPFGGQAGTITTEHTGQGWTGYRTLSATLPLQPHCHPPFYLRWAVTSLVLPKPQLRPLPQGPDWWPVSTAAPL